MGDMGLTAKELDERAELWSRLIGHELQREQCVDLETSAAIVKQQLDEDRSDKILYWRGSTSDLLTDIKALLSQWQTQELHRLLGEDLQKDRRPPVVEPVVSDPIGGLTYDEAMRQRDAYKAASQAVKAEMLAKWGGSKMGRADYTGTLDLAEAWRWIRLLGLEMAL